MISSTTQLSEGNSCLLLEAYANGQNALNEAAQKMPEPPSCIEMPEATPSLSEILAKKTQPIFLETSFSELQGRRRTMEDAHCKVEWKEGAFSAIFDGHIGNKVASFASLFFEENCEEYISGLGPASGLQQLFAKAQETLIETRPKEEHIQGATVVACYIDRKTHAIYTATLGDSEAAIFHFNENDDSVTYTPLSCVRNWKSPEDLERVRPFIPNISEIWADEEDPKKCRVNKLNVSRALGDLHLLNIVSQEPIISVNILKDKDLLVLACDGLWDALTLRDISEALRPIANGVAEFSFAANELSSRADGSINGGDNVSVYVLKVLERTTA